jgi:hypothetical protein
LDFDFGELSRAELPILDWDSQSKIQNPKSPIPDFFGFFGALKKGEFFGLHPKKVPTRVVPALAAQKSEVSKFRFEFNL